MKKLRIGILTFHRSINYGAMTQCFALQQKIQADFPNDIVEVIDYIPKSRYEFYKPTLKNFLFSNWQYINSKVVRAKAFWNKVRHIGDIRSFKIRYTTFQKSLDCLHLSSEFYCTDDVDVFRNSIVGKYDVIVVGSDCVWEWSILGLPCAYFLSGDFNSHKFSYAACSGIDDCRDLDNQGKDYLRHAFSSYDYLGVRDSATAFNAQELSHNQTVFRNCDPTTLINPICLKTQREQVKERLTLKGINWSKPVVGLMCNEIVGKLAYDIFGDRVQYVGVYTPNKYADIFLEDLLVLEWASIFGLFTMTFTTFFHGTMLSLVNRIPVLSFDYYAGDKEHLSKIEELYIRLELPGYYHKGKRLYDKYDIEYIGKIAQYMLNNSQYDLIDEKIKKESESYNTFHEALKALHV